MNLAPKGCGNAPVITDMALKDPALGSFLLVLDLWWNARLPMVDEKVMEAGTVHVGKPDHQAGCLRQARINRA